MDSKQIAIALRGGNPGMQDKTWQQQHGFAALYDWGTPCETLQTIRLPPSWKDQMPDQWAEICRQAIFELISSGESCNPKMYRWGEPLNYQKTLRVPTAWDGEMPGGWGEYCRKRLADEMGLTVGKRYQPK